MSKAITIRPTTICRGFIGYFILSSLETFLFYYIG